MLLFISSIGEFAIPELLCGPETLMIGKIILQELFINRDWLLAPAVKIIMQSVSVSYTHLTLPTILLV